MASKKRKINYFFTFVKVILVIIIAVTMAGYVSVKTYLKNLPPIPQLNNYNRNIVTQVYSNDDHLIKTFQAYHYEEAKINEIPQYLKDAIISTEDKNFYTHEGYDIMGIARSMVVNTLSKRTKQGASTITQQLARLLFLSNEKTYIRKIKEIQVAARIEKTISKDKILEMYLNNVYLGSGAYGVGAAASTYFNKALSDLTLSECALIAGLPQAPSLYSPYKNIKLAEKRRNKVLKRMYIMDKIDKQQYKSALKEPITLNRKKYASQINIAPYFVDYVLKEIEELGFDEDEITQGGYKITTTLNYEAQMAANEAIKKNMELFHLKYDKQQAALFSFSPTTGQILAYVGGKDYSKSQYDRITQAVRPPGSAFKPFVYTAAIHKGWKPTDPVEDSPVTIGEWSPHNYGEKYKGIMPLYKALAISSNVIAVKMIQDVGVQNVVEISKALGITTPLTHDYTIALGSNGVKLFDMVVAYGNYANGGYRVKPYSVERIETQRGKIIYQAGRTKISKVLDKETAGIMTAMLRKVITNGTGRRANIGKPMGGKTGTTNQNRDAWFIGFTPDIVTGVFIGNDDNLSIGLTGGSAPARIWKDMMVVATEPYGNTEFDYPAVDFTIDFEEISYEKLLKQKEEEEKAKLREQMGIMSIFPFGKKDNESVDKENFKEIPLQINEGLLDKLKNKRAEKQAEKQQLDMLHD